MKNPDTKKYDAAYRLFQAAITVFIKNLSNKLKKLTIKTVNFSANNEVLTLQDNTIYQYNGSQGINKLTIKYPNEDFISTILFSTSKDGKIVIDFPGDSKFVGHKKLEFFNQEHWEINIHNKRVVAVQIFED